MPYMNSNITQPSPAHPTSKTGHARTIRRLCLAAAMGLALAAVTTTYAQVSTINSAFIHSELFQPPIPDATFSDTNTFVNPNIGIVSLTEANVTNAGGNGFANKDAWYFSANGGTSPYQFQSNDYFFATFTVTVTGGTPGKDIEGGLLFSDPSGNFGGDLGIFFVGYSGVVFQGGGPSYYPFSPAAGGYPGKGGGVPNYVLGETYTVGLNYVLDPKTGNPSFQYSVNGQFAASSLGDTYFDFGPGQFIGSAGDFLGGYLQIQTDPTNPINSGTAVFSDISIVPQPTLSIVANGNQVVIYWVGGATNFVLQTITNLASTNWTSVTNGAAIMGVTVSNTSPGSYYRLVTGETFTLPQSISTLTCDITSGNGPFASNGVFTVTTSGANYTITPVSGSVAPGAGTFTYSISGDTATYEIVDNTDGPGVLTLNFTGSASGTYLITFSAAPGAAETGAFTIP
jgi:hypothetical protein